MVAAAGVPGILQPEHITPGAVVVGGGVRYEGRKLLPDVDEACEEVAGAITPRVGGVGPTTIAMLFRNAVEAAERNRAGWASRERGPDPSRTRPTRPAAAAVPAVDDVCPLCGDAVAPPADARCRECNMTLAGVGARPAPFTRRSVWLLGRPGCS